eukprot:4576300-Amphidinium_carterae.1
MGQPSSNPERVWRVLHVYGESYIRTANTTLTCLGAPIVAIATLNYNDTWPPATDATSTVMLASMNL